MKHSSEDLKKACLIVGESIGIEKQIPLLLHNVGLYSTIQRIVFTMFVKDKQQYLETDDNVYNAIQMIKEYCNEMTLNGEVIFDFKK